MSIYQQQDAEVENWPAGGRNEEEIYESEYMNSVGVREEDAEGWKESGLARVHSYIHSAAPAPFNYGCKKKKNPEH